jgi:hypothetical protein
VKLAKTDVVRLAHIAPLKKSNSLKKIILRLSFLGLFFIQITQPAQSIEAIWRGALLSSIVAYLASNPLSMEQLGFELGYHTEKDITALKLTNAWNLQKGLLQNSNYRLDSQIRFNIGFWQLGLLSDQGDDFTRHQRNSTNAEFAIHFKHHLTHFPLTLETLSGITYLSTRQMGNVKYGSNIGFVNGLIVGYAKNDNLSLNLSYLHYSNNDIAENNPPDNFIYFGYQKKFNIFKQENK